MGIGGKRQRKKMEDRKEWKNEIIVLEKII
jgi:hypothetical protein